jgi:hypothetical protein
LTRWSTACGGIDVPREIERADCWPIANPAKRPQRLERFLVNWLARAKLEPVRAVASPVATSVTRHPSA